MAKPIGEPIGAPARLMELERLLLALADPLTSGPEGRSSRSGELAKRSVLKPNRDCGSKAAATSERAIKII